MLAGVGERTVAPLLLYANSAPQTSHVVDLVVRLRKKTVIWMRTGGMLYDDAEIVRVGWDRLGWI